MEETKHNTLCSELEKMIDCGPGENEAGLQRVREIVLAYEGDFGSSSSIRESALEVLGGFVTWYSAREWQRYPDFRERLNLSISKLRTVQGKGADEQP
jgi:hypothetical protein